MIKQNASVLRLVKDYNEGTVIAKQQSDVFRV